MLVKVSELTGTALDWAVAKCKRLDFFFAEPGKYLCVWKICSLTGEREASVSYRPSTDWAQAGPLIDKNIGNLFKHNKLDPNEPDVWTAVHYHKTPDGIALYYMDGPTALIAAMRTIVFRFLGDAVEVPEELV